MARHPHKLLFLDGLRGLAALYVMIGHARWLLWEGFAAGYSLHPEQYGAIGKLFVYGSSVFRWGHEAVLFFFVLSGFVIHLRYARRRMQDANAEVDYLPYFRRRARRLYPPLIAALAITFCLDAIGRHYRLPTSNSTTPYPLINATIGHDDGPVTLVKNLAFIMQPPFGSDGPLWSLGYEGWFYVLYPLLFLVARRSLRMATLALGVMSAIGFLPGWPSLVYWLKGVFQLMIVWWFGALLAERFAGRLTVSYRVLSVALLAFVAAPIWAAGSSTRDIFVGAGFAGLIAALLGLEQRGRSLIFLEKLGRLGEMSYTLYVIHFPILVLMGGILMARHGTLPAHFGWVGAGIFVSLGAAWALHWLVERPFSSR